MTAPGVRAIVPVIVGGVLVQSALAVSLVASGRVATPLAFPRDALCVLVGIACGVVLYAALPSSKRAAPSRGSSRGAIVRLGALLATVAIAEEIIWRGYAFASIRHSSGPLVALLTTTVGFAAMHTFAQGWAGLRNHVVTGAAIGLVFWTSGSLASALALHVSYNLMFVVRLQPLRRLS